MKFFTIRLVITVLTGIALNTVGRPTMNLAYFLSSTIFMPFFFVYCTMSLFYFIASACEMKLS